MLEQARRLVVDLEGVLGIKQADVKPVSIHGPKVYDNRIRKRGWPGQTAATAGVMRVDRGIA